MKHLLRLTFLLPALLFLWSDAGAQNNIMGGSVHGSFQLDGNYYNEDTLIGAHRPDEKIGANAFLNVIYTNKDFEAGVRYELYQPPIMGFDPRYKGNGIPYRYVKYTKKNFEITAGNFYEQFGSGMILRAYQEWNLGFDNSIDGVRVKAFFPGITIKGLIGKQRSFWGKGEGTVRGVDAEIWLNDAFKALADMKTRIVIGGNFVSRYQADLDPLYKLPANVGAWSGRIGLFRGNFSLDAEGAYKINDPNAQNNMIYKSGNGLKVTFGYSRRGLGFTLQAKRVDNMDFRSDRNATGFNLPINYIPAMTPQHAYTLPAYYPYSTQPNGEMGLSANLIYKFKKKSFLGGKYGTTIDLSYAVSQAIYKEAINDTTPIGTPGTYGYKSDFFKIGDEKFFHDFSMKISKKLNKKWKIYLTYVNIFYNMEVIEGHKEPNVYAQSGVVDVWWKFKPYNSLHFDVEGLFVKNREDDGDWLFGMIEYKYKSFFAAAIDQWNYGNPDEIMRVHYFSLSTGYTWSSTRVAVTYGKQSSGILCVGGVCREVPATNGFSISLSSSF